MTKTSQNVNWEQEHNTNTTYLVLNPAIDVNVTNPFFQLVLDIDDQMVIIFAANCFSDDCREPLPVNKFAVAAFEFEQLDQGHALESGRLDGGSADSRGNTERVLDGHVGRFLGDVTVLDFDVFEVMNACLEHRFAGFATQERVHVTELLLVFELFLHAHVLSCVK